MKNIVKCSLALVVLQLAGCGSTSNESTNVYKSSIYNDPAKVDSNVVQGIGIESQDILAMTDYIMGSIMAEGRIVDRSTAARVVLDSKYFINESSSRINKNLLTDRLRIQLNSKASDKLVFVGREYIAMIEKERALKRTGTTDAGTIRTTSATAGADFRLTGRISSLDAVNSDTQQTSRYHQIIFELYDLELGTVAWNGIYEFKKTAQDNVIYR
ncbi:penicillin-binding protein activator LpoB [Colwellia sp. MSW7]|uniref:Penicillin-binding protein activator LpoB n=1 Tax=Colwellia maritima TaxID=2912588 RepID=A0ABS9X4M2_9GAMM|nr:penicillin-binding protein activator LpoB [Colwellia maritima]MCI2285030.1 penicillin-binding protein activator LpoB [Colwellia maritima]